jgi:hypothetical protein
MNTPDSRFQNLGSSPALALRLPISCEKPEAMTCKLSAPPAGPDGAMVVPERLELVAAASQHLLVISAIDTASEHFLVWCTLLTE